MNQGTKEWLDWRRKHVGASDQTHLQMCAPWSRGWAWLYDNKMGLEPEPEETEPMRRGSVLETQARQEYIIETGIEVEPALIVHGAIDYISASLDGFNRKAKKAIETKCPGKEDHDKAVAGKIPTKYIPQLCHQLAVTGFESIDYVSFDGHKIAIVPYQRNEELIEKVVNTAADFWAFIKKGERPKGDYPCPEFDTRMPEIDNPKALREAQWNIQLRDRIKEAEVMLEESDKKILSFTKLEKAGIGGLQIVTTRRQGTVDYSKIDVLKDLDLEKFRKKGSVTRSLRRRT